MTPGPCMDGGGTLDDMLFDTEQEAAQRKPMTPEGRAERALPCECAGVDNGVGIQHEEYCPSNLRGRFVREMREHGEAEYKRGLADLDVDVGWRVTPGGQTQHVWVKPASVAAYIREQILETEAAAYKRGQAAERERCAKIALGLCGVAKELQLQAPCAVTAEQIAAAIRAGGGTDAATDSH